MDCRKAAQYLYEYVDRELDGQTMAEVEAHLKLCRHCFDAFDMEFKIKELVRQRSAASPQAEALKGRILAELQELASRPQKELAKGRRIWLWGGSLAAAAVVLLFAFGLPDLGDESNPLVLQAVAEHQSHLAVAAPKLSGTFSLDSVNFVLTSQLGFDPEVNRLKNLASNLKAFHAGAWNGKPAACLYLSCPEGKQFSFLICRESAGLMPKGKKRMHNDKEYVLASHQGLMLAFWVWDGMLCCTIGQCTEKELLDFTASV